MLPQITPEDAAHPSTRTIFINPNFNKTIRGPFVTTAPAAAAARNVNATTTAHVNPLFLRPPRPPAIHMNPQFLQRKLLEQRLQQLQQLKENAATEKKVMDNAHSNHLMNDLGKLTTKEKSKINPNNGCKIIAKSRTCIVREPALVQKVTKPINVSAPAPIIRLSRCKLVRHVATPAARATALITTLKPKLATTVALSKHVPTTARIGKYKVDNRAKRTVGAALKSATLAGTLKRRSFVARYALRRSTSEQSIIRRKVIPSATLKKSRFKLQSLPVNKQLHLLNINGVLYKSTRNKLQRKDAHKPPTIANNAQVPAKSEGTTAAAVRGTTTKLTRDRTIFVRGTKFVMDANGYKLTRIAAPPSTSNISTPTQPSVKQRQRIDIGGLTYVASNTQNVFVRTRNHLALAHLNTAKQRSLQLLTSRLVKSNVPCAIYQRVGRCVAHERGKCNKFHDKKQVVICQRFLRSDCHDPNCLLSHNVSLSKMPVCKFYLQGVCVRPDCPYLHKKLSTTAGICVDFLRGYCKLAEQCNKRHEFICPEYARMGQCRIVNCTYCRTHKRKANTQQMKSLKLTKVKEKSAKVEEHTLETNKLTSTKETDPLPLRYFSGKTNIATSGVAAGVETNSMDIEMSDNTTTADVTTSSDAMSASAEEPTRRVRPKVGTLPAFIPLS